MGIKGVASVWVTYCFVFDGFARFVLGIRTGLNKKCVFVLEVLTRLPSRLSSYIIELWSKGIKKTSKLTISRRLTFYRIIP